jgi:hypothetical protein
MSDKENKGTDEKIEDVIDMNQVRNNENTPLGRSSIGEIGRNAATRSSEDITMADNADKEIEAGIEDKEKGQEPEKD